MGVFVKNSLMVKAVTGEPSLTNLFVWADPSDSGNVTKSGGRFDQVNDKSGNGYHFTSSGTSRPFDGRLVNGREVMDFQGAQYMTTGNFSSSQSQPNVYILAFVSDDLVAFNRVLDGNQITRQTIFTLNSSNEQFIYAGTNRSGGVADPTNLHIITVVFNVPNSIFYEDGVLINTTGSVGSNTQPGLTIGARYDINNFLDGAILEVFMYNNIISSADMNQTGRYLSAKWNIPYTDIP